MPGISEVDSKKKALAELISQKDDLEALIEAYKSQAMFNELLVDLEGFPRNDLDLVAIRTARNKYVCTQNDHKNMMKKIEFAMTEYHQAVKESKISPKFSSQQPNESWKPFAIVGPVTPGSPAFLAGLKEGDLIVQCDWLTCENFLNLPQMGQILKEKENREISISVKREEKFSKLYLVPKKWSGNGLLGAVINLYKH